MLSLRRGASVAALVGLLALSSLVAAGDRPDALEKGKPAPELKVGSWKNSKELKLDDLKGKVVLIDMWGVW